LASLLRGNLRGNCCETTDKKTEKSFAFFIEIGNQSKIGLAVIRQLLNQGSNV